MRMIMKQLLFNRLYPLSEAEMLGFSVAVRRASAIGVNRK
jgi:hypothetical protein